jgi:hypothetical protein
MDITFKDKQKVNSGNKGIGYLEIYHQNIRAIRKKTNELISHLRPNLPQILCLTKHHLK